MIIVYDIILTFNREVDCMWRKKFNLATVLFISQRYLALIEVVLNLASPASLHVCGRVFTLFLLAFNLLISNFCRQGVSSLIHTLFVPEELMAGKLRGR